MRNPTFTAAILTLSLVLVSRPSVQAQIAESRPDIVQIEYFVDADPGRGLGKQVDVSAGPEQDLNFTADLGDIDAGFHILYVRVKDETGNWSLTQAQPFVRERTRLDETPRITALEYFVDEDPGPGNGTEVTLEEDVDLDQHFSVGLGDTDAGFHILYVRIQDEFGNWSLTQAQPFVQERTRLDTSARVASIQYYFTGAETKTALRTFADFTSASTICRAWTQGATTKSTCSPSTIKDGTARSTFVLSRRCCPTALQSYSLTSPIRPLYPAVLSPSAT